MSEAVIAALITGGLSLAGVLVANGRSAQAMDAKLDKQQAVMETRLDDLTREVRTHNNFAVRIPALEERVNSIQRHLDDLERSVRCE